MGLAESESLITVEELREVATLVDTLHAVERQLKETATRLLRDVREIPDPDEEIVRVLSG